jgi:LmbE family N-acetylglucosaminyl deacetylase
VLYVAAHPDDENTRLIAWLAREKKYRTGYLSLTRGDGGQNLIGEEQGVELGLIRTQELLAARRIDGGEQYFSRAYDFGFSKNTEEALQTWGREKILSDAVWVIRNFRPDVIIARFPEDSRAGHGHHSASGVIAREAFIAAADPKRFPEQLTFGVQTWQAKRILWNTFNFGGANTTADNQFKVDVGGYLPLLGRSLGEISAESRSQHKSQGFGVPSSRGSSLEYFSPVLGDVPKIDLLDGVDVSWNRIEGGQSIGRKIDELIRNYAHENPSASVPALTGLHRDISALPTSVWREQKLKELSTLIEAAAGLYLEASTPQAYAVQDDSLTVSLQAISRSDIRVRWVGCSVDGRDTVIGRPLQPNRNQTVPLRMHVSPSKPLSQPYWLEEEMEKGSFRVTDQRKIGLPENPPAYAVNFQVEIEGVPMSFLRPVMFKSTDPVKGELFQPLSVVPPLSLNTSPGVMLFRNDRQSTRPFQLNATAYTEIPPSAARISYEFGNSSERVTDSAFSFVRGQTKSYSLPVAVKQLNGSQKLRLLPRAEYRNAHQDQSDYLAIAQVQYDHIPVIRYFYPDGVTLLNIPLETAGKRIGYIRGAGDKVPEALQEMGYEVVFLGEKDLDGATLKTFDAIVTGVRAYNIHEWLNGHYEVLMDYVKGGGNLVVQYNTNSFIGPVKARMGPFGFNITRNRVTDENSPVSILDPKDPVLNRPNRIGPADFDGWVQERGIYFAETPAAGYRTVLGMKDPGERDEQQGSLVVAQHGKGRFIYTGLVFFRELPAGVPGAYRLFANLVSNPNAPINGNKK